MAAMIAMQKEPVRERIRFLFGPDINTFTIRRLSVTGRLQRTQDDPAEHDGAQHQKVVTGYVYIDTLTETAAKARVSMYTCMYLRRLQLRRESTKERFLRGWLRLHAHTLGARHPLKPNA